MPSSTGYNTYLVAPATAPDPLGQHFEAHFRALFGCRLPAAFWCGRGSIIVGPFNTSGCYYFRGFLVKLRRHFGPDFLALQSITLFAASRPSAVTFLEYYGILAFWHSSILAFRHSDYLFLAL